MLYSEVESKRFDLRIFREKIEDSYVEYENIKSELVKNDVEVLILRLPTLTAPEHYKLLCDNYRVIHADSLLYYKNDLQKSNDSDFRNNFSFECVGEANKDCLNKIIPVIFSNYQNHYFSNPLLDRSKIISGYIEWAMSYSNVENGKIAWIVKDREKDVAFATCYYDENKKMCDGILYGVMPEYAGRGVYSDLITFTKSFFKRKGYEQMYVSTQLQNVAVQKVWCREGFRLDHSYETYHIVKKELFEKI